MLNALISHKDQTAVLTLPMERYSLQYELAQIGIRRRLTDIPISDEEEQDIQVKLYADSDIGKSLAVLFKPPHSLDNANLCAHMVENARPELLEELEQHIVHGQYHSPQAVMADIKAMTDELIGVTVNYYCPLKFQMNDAEYGDLYETDNSAERRFAQRMKDNYPPGTRIMLLGMDDPYAPVPEVTKGTVVHVDDAAQIHMKWDNGRTLAIVPGEDSFRRLTDEELAEEQQMDETQDFGMKML